jgi:uncharacterized membrane protein YeaQ/YmgE (transglycosylase-associated protein family)
MNVFLLNLVIQIMAGAVGGNAAATLLRYFNLGPLGNSLTGMIGGALGGQILNEMLTDGVGTLSSSAALEIGSLLTQIVGGAVGGGIFMVIVALIRQTAGGQGGRV